MISYEIDILKWVRRILYRIFFIYFNIFNFMLNYICIVELLFYGDIIL